MNRNVSREPNIRFTTILLKKIKENDRKMSTEEPNFRYATTLLKKIKENVLGYRGPGVKMLKA